MKQSALAQLSSRERARREILVRSDLIAPLPDIVVRVLALLGKGTTEPKDLEAHLQCDPALVGKMLGIVNSPLYGVAHPVKSIRDAIMVLGFRGLRSLLLASGTAAFLKRDYRCYGHDKMGLWKHSLVTAAGARKLALTMGQSADRVEELFVAGLLHDIGKMLLAPYLSGASPGRPGEPSLSVERERDLLGLDHAEAGALVASRWGLCPVAQAVLRHHHDVAPPPDMQIPVAIVRLADAVAHGLGIGFEPGHVPPDPIAPADLTVLQLDPVSFDGLRVAMADAARAGLQQMERMG